ncbi:MAG TPA: DUF433 domain-containing protein [Candidatus Kapabacteria bacterium]|nr:DUF433 domain-containing protein [Candidatus Kapabacteria bacterium]
MDDHRLTVSDPDILGGVLVFAGTRVPVRTLFDYLEDDFSLTEFLEFFPTVPRDLALAVLEEAEHNFSGNVSASASR